MRAVACAMTWSCLSANSWRSCSILYANFFSRFSHWLSCFNSTSSLNRSNLTCSLCSTASRSPLLSCNQCNTQQLTAVQPPKFASIPHSLNSILQFLTLIILIILMPSVLTISFRLPNCWASVVEMLGSVTGYDVCDIIATICAYADQCCRDVHGRLVMSHALDAVAGLVCWLGHPISRDAPHSRGGPVVSVH